MNKMQNGVAYSKMFLMWIPVLIVIFIKSNTVLFSLYSMNTIILLYSVYNIATILFLISFSFIFSQKGQLFYLFGVDLFISVLFIVDMVYGRAYGHLISIYMIFAKDVTGDLNASVLSLIKWTDFLLLIDLPFLLILAVKSKSTVRLKKRIFLFYFTAVLSAAVICFQFVRPEDSNMLGNYKLQPLIMSPIGYHMFDIYRFAYEKTYTLNDEDIIAADSWLEENTKYQIPKEDYTYLEGSIKGKNIIAIQIESLENIVVGLTNNGQEITPNINRLLGSSIYFKHIYEQVRDGNSSDAELLFNASLYPISNGSSFLRFGENTYNTLPNLLHEKGYTSIAIHGDDKEFWNRYRVFPAMGFDDYIDEDKFEDKSSGGMGILDKSLFSQSLSEIKKLKEPYNVFIITLTSHIPFKLDEENKYLNIPDDNETSDYLQSIHYTDKVFGVFYDQLKAEGLLDNTVLILYGDHEGVHKYYSTTLQENNKEIPFIISIPGSKGFVMDKIGGQVDMLPTLAYLLGIEKEKYSHTVMGCNLFGNTLGTAILPTGEILGEPDDKEHLIKAQSIADIIIKGNYFNVK